MNLQNKIHIGDGVYLEVNGPYEIILTSYDGVSTTNVIFLEYSMLKAINKFVEAKLKEL